MFEVCTLFVNRKKDIQSKEDGRCSCAFVMAVIRVGGVDETLLIKHFFVHLLHMGFYARLILFLHKSERSEAALPGMRTTAPGWACAGFLGAWSRVFTAASSRLGSGAEPLTVSPRMAPVAPSLACVAQTVYSL